MRFLTVEKGDSCINIDNITSISIKPGDNMGEYVLLVISTGNAMYRFYRGDFMDTKMRYMNLLNLLANMDVPSIDFIPNNNMVVMKDDGTFFSMENSLWEPELKQPQIINN